MIYSSQMAIIQNKFIVIDQRWRHASISEVDYLAVTCSAYILALSTRIQSEYIYLHNTAARWRFLLLNAHNQRRDM
jgi:hypothetical protein